MSFDQTNLIKLYGEHDTHIVIQEDGDGLGMVQASAQGDHYGKIEFSMDPEEAIVFANAIIQQAKYLKEKQ